MATITPLTGQTANTTQNQRADLPQTDNVPKSRSTETVTPKQNSVDAVQQSEQTKSRPIGGEEEKSQNTPEKPASFTTTL